MPLLHLKISNFRNILQAELDFSPICNVFFGCNGSGKTSVLEAIYYIGHGRSFRTHLPQRIINNLSENFSLFTEFLQNDLTTILPIGIERNKTTSLNKMRLSGENLRSIAELAILLPIQLINQNSFQLLSSGSKFRRKFLDWGLFHVEPSFLPLWKRLNRAVLQRNTALKSYSNVGDIKLWDRELVETSNNIHELRKKYIDNLIIYTNNILKEILGNYDITINYNPGWNSEKDFDDLLTTNLNRDKTLGYTQFGAHKADLIFKIDGLPVHDVLSRGQQKIFFLSLQIAQAILLTELTGKKCLYLIDDLPSELDFNKRISILNIISKTNSQSFITSLNQGDILTDAFENCKMFHVEQGKIHN